MHCNNSEIFRNQNVEKAERDEDPSRDKWTFVAKIPNTNHGEKTQLDWDRSAKP